MSVPTRATIYDVADAAGVAISTVSRVLNHSPEVSAATRARVEAAVAALRYQPQRSARTLASRAPTALAVALPSATSLFYVEILKGVKDVLVEHDLDLMLSNLGSLHPRETLIRFLDRGAVEALLLISLDVDADLAERLQRIHAPVVLLGGSTEPGLGTAVEADVFRWDDRQGAREAVRHLIDLGHRRIGMVASHDWSLTGAPRRAGYADALAEAGIEPEASLVAIGRTVKHAGYSEEAGAEAMARLMALPDPPTAVFAESDVQAYGAWAWARDHGLVVPRDVSLVGYDGLKLSRFLDLTTVEQRMQEAGRRAAECLVQRLGGDRAPALDVSLPADLVVRGSTAPPTR